MTRPLELPTDVESLTALLLAERARVSERDAQIARLEHTVHLFSKWLWGPRTEKRQAEVAPALGQEHLPFAELLEAAQRVADQHGAQGSLEIELPKAPRSKGKPRRQFPAHLPIVRTTIVIPEAERTCCQKPMATMGAEVTRELERIEGASSKLEIDRARLAMLLDGVDTKNSRLRRNFVREISIRARGDDERARATH